MSLRVDYIKNTKAQFWSFDIIFSIIVFSTAVTILGFTWYSISTQLGISYSGSSTIMQLDSQSFAQSIMSPGYPKNWYTIVNTTNTVSWNGVTVGLLASNGSYIVSSRKLYTIIAMSNYNYTATKTAMGVSYNYFITITNNPHTGIPLNISIGENPATNNALTVYIQNRNSFIDGVPVKINLVLWTSNPGSVS